MVARCCWDSGNSGIWVLGTLERKAPVLAASAPSSEGEGERITMITRRAVGVIERAVILPSLVVSLLRMYDRIIYEIGKEGLSLCVYIYP